MTHIRGDTLVQTFTLGGGWTSSDLQTLQFTARSTVPASTVVDDTGAIATASLADGRITFAVDGVTGTIEIPAAVTKSWSPGVAVWDLQAVTTAGKTYTIDSGTLRITADITRS